MKNILIILLLLPFATFAQRDLKPITDGADNINVLIGKAGAKIKKATVASETGVTMELGLELEGFKRDKKYKLKGEVLSKTKLKLKEIEPVTVDVASSSNSVEMAFKFIASATSAYTNNKVESHYIRLTISELDARLGDLLGDTGLNSSVFLFECKKDWRVKANTGNNNVIVDVKLVPFKSAATIRPNSN